jgi:cbb3-type cytochrome oxidase maturation protein
VLRGVSKLRISTRYIYKNLEKMGVIILLLLASVLVAAVFLGGFIWSVKNGQYDDEYSPPVRMLFDDEPGKEKTKQ